MSTVKPDAWRCEWDEWRQYHDESDPLPDRWDDPPRVITELFAAPVARPLAEYHEDHGPVVWWVFPIVEPSWIGRPDDSDWPGHHTHWTPHPPMPKAVKRAASPPPAPVPAAEPSEAIYRHKKTGNLYVRITDAGLENDGSPMVVYRSKKDGLTWVRPLAEFNDKFEFVERPQPAPIPAPEAPSREQLRKLVDLTWGCAYEDQSVPSTEQSDKLIDSVFAPEAQPSSAEGGAQPEPRIDPMMNPKRPSYVRLGPDDEHPAEQVLRKLACWLGVGGYNAPTVDAGVFHDKIIWGVEEAVKTAAALSAAHPLPVAVEPARKVGGSYQADGFIVSRFKTLAGAERVVFEFANPAGMLHIFTPQQIIP